MIEQIQFHSCTVFLCSKFKLESICSEIYLCGKKNVCGDFYLRRIVFVGGWKNLKIRTSKNFLPHGTQKATQQLVKGSAHVCQDTKHLGTLGRTNGS